MNEETLLQLAYEFYEDNNADVTRGISTAKFQSLADDCIAMLTKEAGRHVELYLVGRKLIVAFE